MNCKAIGLIPFLQFTFERIGNESDLFTENYLQSGSFSQPAGKPIAVTSTLGCNFNDYNISVNEI